MRYFFLFLIGCTHFTKPRMPSADGETRVKIAVIDTGLPVNKKELDPYLCKIGHKDTTGLGIQDHHGHGTNVAGIIASKLNPKKHCLIIIKWYSKLSHEKEIYDAFKHAIESDAKYINFSTVGPGAFPQEKQIIEYALKRGIKVVVSAGNKGANLDIECNDYPACYGIKHKNFYVVMAKDARYSNYGGPAIHQAPGTGVCALDICLSGTSQAAANFTSELVAKENK